MAENVRPAEAVLLTYNCDECGEEMRGLGFSYPTYPQQYPNECKNGHRKILDRSYPTMTIRPVQE